MSETVIVRIPELGDFDEVEVIEVLVEPGSTVNVEDSLITLETDKASMDVPSTSAGRIVEVNVKTGQKVKAGDAIALVALAQTTEAQEPGSDTLEVAALSDAEQRPSAAYSGAADQQVEMLVLGAGVAGYTAAFRAADLGMEVAMIERWPSLGGVCLNVGCIPSKALLHAAKVIDDAAAMAEHGVTFAPPKIETKKLVKWKNSVIGKLTDGLTGLAKRRKVQVIPGVGKFLSDHHIEVESKSGKKVIAFERCVIAAGSEPVMLPFLPDDPRIIDSTGALELEELPERMLVIGGGIIGLEMAAVYAALGVKISIVELTGQLIPGCDADLVKPLHQRVKKLYENVWLNTKVTAVETHREGLDVAFAAGEEKFMERFGRVLVAVGRRPNGKLIDADKAGVAVTDAGFIPSNQHMQTNVPHIFSIGDVRGNPMLAHKGSHEGKVAAEFSHDGKRAFDARVIPSVAYTDPEVAWVGLTEVDAKRDGIKYEKASFPWAASGRALAMDAANGLTKLLFDPDTHRVIGMGAVGTHAGDLVAEATLAIEMGCDAEDIGLTIHAHPTLSESIAMAAEIFDGSITDLYMPKKK